MISNISLINSISGTADVVFVVFDQSLQAYCFIKSKRIDNKDFDFVMVLFPLRFGLNLHMFT